MGAPFLPTASRLVRGEAGMTHAAVLGGAQALLGASLLHQELHKVLEGQGCSVESFEGEGLERLGAVDDDPPPCVSRQVQGDPLAC